MATKKKSAKKPAASRAKAKSKAKTKAPAKKAPARRAAAPRGKPGAMRLGSVSPSFTVNDLAKSIAFYRDVLGFAVSQRWEHEGVLRGVELASGDVTFMIGQDDWQKGRDRLKGVGFRLYCTTNQDIDVLAREIKAKGGVLDGEPVTEMWGRFFGFSDPDGFKITVVNEKVRKR